MKKNRPLIERVFERPLSKYCVPSAGAPPSGPPAADAARKGAVNTPVCPNCSLPRRALNWDGEVFKCGGCGGWYHRDFVLDRPDQFSLNPGPDDGPEAA